MVIVAGATKNSQTPKNIMLWKDCLRLLRNLERQVSTYSAVS